MKSTLPLPLLLVLCQNYVGELCVSTKTVLSKLSKMEGKHLSLIFNHFKDYLQCCYCYDFTVFQKLKFHIQVLYSFTELTIRIISMINFLFSLSILMLHVRTVNWKWRAVHTLIL